jgi:hypothetical protein
MFPHDSSKTEVPQVLCVEWCGPSCDWSIGNDAPSVAERATIGFDTITKHYNECPFPSIVLFRLFSPPD